jgi:hypothetical protein
MDEAVKSRFLAEVKCPAFLGQKFESELVDGIAAEPVAGARAVPAHCFGAREHNRGKEANENYLQICFHCIPLPST